MPKGFDAVVEGIMSCGDRVVYSERGATWDPCDVVLMCSGPKSGRLRDKAISRYRRGILESAREHGAETLCVESPVFRAAEPRGGPWRRLRLSWGGFLRGEGDYVNEGSPPDRWQALGIEPRPMRYNPKGYVLFMRQKDSDASLDRDMDTIQAEAFAAIRERTDREIVVREHPLDVSRATPRSLEMDLAGAFVVVTYTSLSAIDALLHGVPVICLSEKNLAWPVTGRLAHLNAPLFPSDDQLKQWLSDMAYTQWGLDEIRQGVPWRRLRAARFTDGPR